MNPKTINYQLIFRTCALFLFGFFTWFFPQIMLYLFLSFIFSLIGKPLANLISKRTFFKLNIPLSVSSLIVVVLFVIIFTVSTLFFIPMLISELTILKDINYDALSVYLNDVLNTLQQKLHENNLIDESDTLVGLITIRLKEFINIESFSSMLGNIVNSMGSFFFGLFSVVFITYFFIKDNFQLAYLSQIFFSKQYARRVNYVSNKINDLLSRYLIGTLLNTIIMMILLYIGLIICGIDGSLLLAVMGGVLNIIPYLGPIFGCIIACLFGIINCISLEMYSEMLPVIIKIVGVFVLVNLLDNMILLPIIYSKSVKIHPIESFLVTIIGGDLAGISGMLLAIPVYTIIRIIVIEIYNFTYKDKPWLLLRR